MANDANADVNCRRPQCRVLLVEADVADRRRLTGMLEARDYTVHAAANGQEALDYLRTHPPPAVILLDIALEAAGGVEFRRAQRDDPTLADIAVIALAPAGVTVASAGALGDVGYLRKPVRGEQLVTALKRYGPNQSPELLLVEDDAAILRMLEMMLRYHGFSIREARSGSEAIAIFEQHRATIDVVLLDVQMPDLDGPQTLTVLRALNPDIGVFFMSGNTGEYTIEDLLRRGARHVLQKPFRSMAELMRLLYQVAQRPDRPTIAPAPPRRDDHDTQ